MRLRGLRAPPSLTNFTVQQRGICDVRPFAVGDLVLLRQKLDRAAPPILTKPLKHGKRIETHKGIIQHDDIIGHRVRDIVSSTTIKSTKAGTDFRLHPVTLDDYVRLTKRLVTPVYPADANLIVNLLDLHSDLGYADDAPHQLHILEAGTGHGSLTLHLSRAVHAVNALHGGAEVDYDDANSRRQRKAIIHTTDVSPKVSAHAREIVCGFRHGLYARNVDFHVGDASDVVQTLGKNQERSNFLSHAILDLPAADAHLGVVADALRVDGSLIVFNPSITQITDCAKKIKKEGIPLDLDKVIELGVNAGSGGREWDVRLVRPRSVAKVAIEMAEAREEAAEQPEDAVERSELQDRSPESLTDHKWSMVCRPKVGDRIVGGGFVGVWKKQREKEHRSAHRGL